MAYPSFLEVTADRSDCGKVKYLNSSATSEDDHAVFRIARGRIKAGCFPKSLPVHLEIAGEGCEASRGSLIEKAKNARKTPPDWFYPLSVRFKVYGTTDSKSTNH